MAILSLPCLFGLATLLPADDFGIAMATYLGDGSDHEAVRAVRIQADGDIVVAVEAGPATPLLADAPRLGGADAEATGAILILAPDGRTVKAKARIPGQPRDLALDARDNLYLAAGDGGLLCLSPEANAIRWQALAGTYVHRVDVGRAGTVAALAPANPADADAKAGNGTVCLFAPDGRQLAAFKGGAGDDRNVLDLCVDDASLTLVTIGWRQSADWSEAANKGGPVQIAFLRGLGYDGKVKWNGYDWSTDGASERYLNKPENNMADTRGLRCCLGPDGKLNAVYGCAGGNHLFRYRPESVTTPSAIVGGDPFSDFSGSKSDHKTFFGRYAPGTGAIELGQCLTARISPTKTNTLWCEGGEIAVDRHGRVYLAGFSAYGLPMWPNRLFKPRDGEATFNPFGQAGYLGGPFLVAYSPDFTRRAYVTRIAQAGRSRTVAVGVRPDGGTAIAWGGQAELQHPIYTCAPLQPTPGYGKADGFLVVHGQDADESAAPEPQRQRLEFTLSGLIAEASKKGFEIRDHKCERRVSPDHPGDIAFLYPWRTDAPLSPPASVGYTGLPFYGGLRVDVQDADPKHEAAQRDNLENPFRMWFAVKQFPGESLRLHAAIYIRPQDLPGAKPGDRFSLNTDSFLESLLSNPCLLTYPMKTPEGKPSWQVGYWVTTEFRWLVRDAGKFYLSRQTPKWTTHQDQTFQQGFVNDSQDGEWAEWIPDETLAFDPAAAAFRPTDFRQIEGIGFHLADPTFRPTPESEAAGVNRPGSAGCDLRIRGFSGCLAVNDDPRAKPTAHIDIDRPAPCVGEEVVFDATGSTDTDGTIQFISWDFGDGAKDSGPVVRHTFWAAGRHRVRVTVWDDQLQSDAAELALTVFPKGTADAAKPRITACFGGLVPPSGKLPDIPRNRQVTRVSDKDLDGDGVADQVSSVPYREDVPFLSRPEYPGTALHAGWTDHSRLPLADGKNTHINNALGIGNPAQYKKIDTQGRFAVSCRVRPGTPGRVAFLTMILKPDFVNGADDPTARVVIDAETRLSAGPFLHFAPQAGIARFVLRDAEGYWLAEEAFRVEKATSDQTSYDALPVYAMDFKGRRTLPRWAKFDPLAGLPPTGTAQFIPKRFADITGFGLLVDAETIGPGHDVAFYNLLLDARILGPATERPTGRRPPPPRGRPLPRAEQKPTM